MVTKDWLYRRRIRIGLGRAYKRADEETVELSTLNAVVFSDHHRGKQDGADDFPPLRGGLPSRARPLP